MKAKSQSGFSLIELLVAMFIFSLIMVAMVSVSVAGFQSYGKSKAIKKVSEDVGLAMNAITKDVRMGKIEDDNAACASTDLDDLKPCLVVTRNNSQQAVCYSISSSKLSLFENATCSGNPKNIVDLSGTEMSFDTTKSGFYSKVTDTSSPNQGWAEMNIAIESASMSTDSIWVQTSVSSRDYGWEDVP